jgi:hypothetical protein
MEDDDADAEHVFVASGDACEICLPINGEIVPAGYTAHPECLCQTKPRRKGASDCDPMIDLDFATVGGTTYAVFSVEVRCPSGGSAAATGSTVARGNDHDLFIEAMSDARVGRLAVRKLRALARTGGLLRRVRRP